MTAVLCAKHVALGSRVCARHVYFAVVHYRCHHNLLSRLGFRLVLGKLPLLVLCLVYETSHVFFCFCLFQIYFELLNNKSFWLALTVIATCIFAKDMLLLASRRIFFPTNEDIIQEVADRLCIRLLV